MTSRRIRNVALVLFCSMFCSNTWSQVELSVTKLDSNIFSIKVFNSLTTPIGIRCSPTISKVSEKDTLQLKIPEWYNGNGQDYYYDLDFTSKDLSTSEGSLYSLCILSSQSYLITNICLVDYSIYKKKMLHFGINFKTSLTGEDFRYFSTKDPSHLIAFPPTKEMTFDGEKSMRLN